MAQHTVPVRAKPRKKDPLVTSGTGFCLFVSQLTASEHWTKQRTLIPTKENHSPASSFYPLPPDPRWKRHCCLYVGCPLPLSQKTYLNKYVRLHGVTNWNIYRPSCTCRFVRFWASGGAKFPKMGDSLPWPPMSRRAKFDATSFIVGREICNHTNTHKNKQQPIYPHLAYQHVWITRTVCVHFCVVSTRVAVCMSVCMSVCFCCSCVTQMNNLARVHAFSPAWCAGDLLLHALLSCALIHAVHLQW